MWLSILVLLYLHSKYQVLDSVMVVKGQAWKEEDIAHHK